jgi:hypothetical protein
MKFVRLAAVTAGLVLPALAASAQYGSGAPSPMTVPSTQTSSPPAPAPAKPTASGKDPSQQVICRNQEEIGSRLGGKRVCMTKAQWAQQAQDSRDAVDTAQRTPH